MVGGRASSWRRPARGGRRTRRVSPCSRQSGLPDDHRTHSPGRAHPSQPREHLIETDRMLRAATASSTSWRKISLTSNGTTWTDMAKRGARVADAEGGGRRTGEATRRREGLAGDVFCKDEARDGRRRWASNRSERVRALRGREAEARAAARVSMVALAQHAEAQPVNCLGRPCSRGGTGGGTARSSSKRKLQC